MSYPTSSLKPLPKAFCGPPLRRSARIIARDAARLNRTPEEIQATLYSFKQMNARTLNDVNQRMQIDFDRFEKMVKDRTDLSTTYYTFMRKLYLEQIATFRHCYFIHFCFAVDTIKGLTEIKDSIPCVVMAESVAKSLHDFVQSLKYDLNNGYVMNNLVTPYCESKIKLLRDHM